MAGTDAPNPGTVFGASLHRGRVEVGLRADLVLVFGDPLGEITETRSIEQIWRGERACDRRSFVASAAEAEQLDSFEAQISKVVETVRKRRSAVGGRGTSST